MSLVGLVWWVAVFCGWFILVSCDACGCGFLQVLTG